MRRDVRLGGLNGDALGCGIHEQAPACTEFENSNAISQICIGRRCSGGDVPAWQRCKLLHFKTQDRLTLQRRCDETGLTGCFKSLQRRCKSSLVGVQIVSLRAEIWRLCVAKRKARKTGRLCEASCDLQSEFTAQVVQAP